MKKILLSVALLISVLDVTNAQSKAETANWIQSKLWSICPRDMRQTRSMRRDENDYFYTYHTIHFWTLPVRGDSTDRLLSGTISDGELTNTEGHDVSNYRGLMFRLSDISRVEYIVRPGEIPDNCPIFIFHVRASSIKLYKINDLYWDVPKDENLDRTMSSVTIAMDVSSEENLGERLKKAFDHYISLNAPKEAF